MNSSGNQQQGDSTSVILFTNTSSKKNLEIMTLNEAN